MTVETDLALAAERADWRAQIALLQAELDACMAPPGAMIGACLPFNNLYGNVPGVARIFMPPGDQSVQLNLSTVPDAAMIILSRKDRGNWFSATLDWVKANHPGELVVCAGVHEPENDALPVSTYASWVREDAAMIEGKGLTSCQILMGGTANLGTWEQWVVPEADWLCWDVYHGGAARVPKTYKAPETWLKVYFDANVKVGKPIAFPEFASLPIASDNLGTGLVEWMRTNSRYCRTHPTLKAAAWFNGPGAKVRFQNAAQADAWLKP